MAKEVGETHAFELPGFVPAYIRPLFCRGIGPFRWVALSGDPEDIRKTDEKVKELVPGVAPLHTWLDNASRRIRFQGLPRADLLGGIGRSSPHRPRLQRDGGARRDRSGIVMAATIWIQARSPVPTGRPRR